METLIKPSSNMFHFDNIYYDKPMITNNFSIFQIGDLFCKSDTVVGDHQQLYQLELSFVVEGSGTIFTNDIPTKVNKGDIYISLKDETHKLTSDSIENMRYYYFALNFNTDSPYAQIIDYLEKNHKSEKNRVITLPNIFPLMTNILSELIDMKLFSLEIIESNIQQILISIYRRKDNKSNLYVYTPDIRKGMAYNIVNYIDQNYASIENLIEIATKFNYDYSHLAKVFKDTIGATMHDYLQDKKLFEAKRLLSEGKTVTDISVMLNYSSMHNFSRAFKNKFGKSPTFFTK